VIRAALNIVGGIVHTIETLPGKLLGVARGAGSKIISGLANGVRSRIGSLVSFFGRIGKSILDALVNAIKAAPGAIINAITSIIPDKLKGAVRKVVPGLASGGSARRGGWAVVGERGPELAHLPSGSTVYDSRQTQRARASMASGGGGTMTLNVHLSGKQIHSEVFRVDRQMAEAT
jgi:phage-related protein